MTRPLGRLLRWPLILLALALLAAAALAAETRPGCAAPGSREPIRVLDGDTFEDSCGRRWRFPGADAPALRREGVRPTCRAERLLAEAAAARLRALVRDGAVVAPTGEDCLWGRGCADLMVGTPSTLRSAIAVGLDDGWLRPWPSCAAGRCSPDDRPDWCRGETE